jgi:hypothetical protein
LDAHHEVGIEHLQARLDEPLLLERVAHLHAGTLGCIGLVVAESGRCQHRHTADAVAPRGGTEQDGQVSHARRPPQHQPFHGQDTEAEHVDERIVLIRFVEHRLTAHRGDAHGFHSR